MLNSREIKYESTINIKNHTTYLRANMEKYQTNPMKCYSIKKMLDKYIMEFILTREDKELYDMVIDIEDKNIQEIFNKSVSLFNKQIPINVIDENQRSIIRMRKMVPIIKFELPENQININQEYEGEYYILMIQYTGIKFHKQFYNSQWQILNIENNVDKNIFNADDDEDDDIFTIYDNSSTIKLQENSQESLNENPQETPQETPKNPQEKPQENPQEKPQKNSQENPQEKPQKNSQKNPQKNSQKKLQEKKQVKNNEEQLNDDQLKYIDLDKRVENKQKTQMNKNDIRKKPRKIIISRIKK